MQGGNMQFVSPVIVRLKGNPQVGEGIVVGGDTYLDIAKEEDGITISRDANGAPMMVKKRDVFVVWPSDQSEIFVHQMNELEPVEVVAVRTLDDMKKEVVEEVLDILESEDDEDEQGEPEVEHQANPS